MCILFLNCLLACTGKETNNNALPTHKDHFASITDTAKLHKEQGRKDLALAYHRTALGYAKGNNLRRQQAEALLEISRLLPRKQADTSLVYLNAALEIAKSLNHYRLQSDIYRTISQIHRQQEDYTSALFALEAHHQLADSLLNEQQKTDLRQADTERRSAQGKTISIAFIAFLIAISLALALFSGRARKLNKKLSQSLSVKDKLFSIIGHDLRGPAGNIRQAIGLINSGGVDPSELPTFLELLGKQSENLNDTLDSLLAWSRTQTEEISAHPILFPASDSITMAIALLDGQARAKGIIVETDILPQSQVYADRDQFDFIIRNLLSNAIKFSNEGGTVRISVRRNRGMMEVLVADNGIGISMERQQIFRSENLETTFGTSGEKGTGLGLRMVKDFIAAAGGRIRLESGNGQTNFCISLPYIADI